MAADLPQVKSPNHLKRLAWLLACVFAGSIIAFAGEWLSGSSAWYVAIPAVVAAGWLFVADPTECEPPRQRRAKGSEQ